jgi:hypothetical protein
VVARQLRPAQLQPFEGALASQRAQSSRRADSCPPALPLSGRGAVRRDRPDPRSPAQSRTRAVRSAS